MGTTRTILQAVIGVHKNPGFYKKMPNTLGFGRFYWVLGFIRFLGFFLNEQFGSLLVDLAHQLSFCLDLPVLQII